MQETGAQDIPQALVHELGFLQLAYLLVEFCFNVLTVYSLRQIFLALPRLFKDISPSYLSKSPGLFVEFPDDWEDIFSLISADVLRPFEVAWEINLGICSNTHRFVFRKPVATFCVPFGNRRRRMRSGMFEIATELFGSRCVISKSDY